MKNHPVCLFLAILALNIPVKAQSKENSISDKEKEEGWILLFDGISLKGWTSADGNKVPETGWVISNGELTSKPGPGVHGGDIITEGEYSDFELTVDFKSTDVANSGIKYFFARYEKEGLLGLEYQILDDIRNDERFGGKNGNHRCAALYDMFPPREDKTLNPVGQWNTAKIVSKGKHVEHWLNGQKVLEFDRLSPAFMKALAESKYKDAVPAFGSVPKGHILLQFHGDEVSFRNIKIKVK